MARRTASSRPRPYDPSTASFTARDPLNALTRSANSSVYGNPLNSNDPSGLGGWTDLLGCAGDVIDAGVRAPPIARGLDAADGE